MALTNNLSVGEQNGPSAPRLFHRTTTSDGPTPKCANAPMGSFITPPWVIQNFLKSRGRQARLAVPSGTLGPEGEPAELAISTLYAVTGTDLRLGVQAGCMAR